VIHYWRKHHGFVGVLGIRSIMLLHHLLRYTLALAAGLLPSVGSAKREVGKQVSSACLRELLLTGVAMKT
jgi:hypothetical protein